MVPGVDIKFADLRKEFLKVTKDIKDEEFKYSDIGTVQIDCETIGIGAFMDSTVEKVEMSDRVRKISGSAFRSCKNLKSVIFGSGLKIIDESAFISCSSLKSIIIPDGTTDINFSAFAGCKDLVSITIPDSVTSMENNIFYGANKDLVVKTNSEYVISYCKEYDLKFERT